MSHSLITKGGTPPTLAARKPTAKPSWPIALIAGVEGSGKSYSAAEASGSELLGRTFAIEIGEGAFDQYGAIPGARFEMLDHDGTFQGIAGQVWAAIAQPRTGGKPNALVIDSMSELWDLMVAEQQAAADQRARNKGRKVGQDGADITMDLWNAAKKRWRALLDLLRTHDGPVILTARMSEVAVMENGRPVEGRKDWKIAAEKSLGFEVDAVLQAREPQVWQVSKVRTLSPAMRLDPGAMKHLPGFTFDKFWRALGLADAETVARAYTPTNGEAYLAELDEDARQEEIARAGQQATGQGRPHLAAVPAAPAETAEERAFIDNQWLAKVDGCTDAEELRALYREAHGEGQLQRSIEARGEVLELHEWITARAEKIKDAAKAETTPAAPATEAPAEAPGTVADPLAAAQATVAAAGLLDTDAHPEPETAAPVQTMTPVEGEVLDGPRPTPVEDPDDMCRNTAQRKAVQNELMAIFGGEAKAIAAIETEFGVPHAKVATKRLREFMTRKQQGQAG